MDKLPLVTLRARRKPQSAPAYTGLELSPRGCSTTSPHHTDPPTRRVSGRTHWEVGHAGRVQGARLLASRMDCLTPDFRSVQQFRRAHQLRDLRAAVGAFIGGRLSHAPLRRDGLDVHRHDRATGANHGGWLSLVMMVDIGWHVGSPTKHSAIVPDPKPAYACGCQNCDLWRARLRIRCVCDKSARLPSLDQPARKHEQDEPRHQRRGHG